MDININININTKSNNDDIESVIQQKIVDGFKQLYAGYCDVIADKKPDIQPKS